MSAVIALLRAVNVGGRTMKAAQLKAVAEGLGHEQVATYVNSGNVVLVPAGGQSASDVAGAPADLDQQLLRAALAAGPVREFAVVRPTLTELYRHVVTAETPEQAGARA